MAHNKIPVGVLAATGTVGQRFISLLANHPWFEVAAVTASERSAGKRYGEAVNWVVPGEIPEATANLEVRFTDDVPDDVPLVFSALPTSIASETEEQLAARGFAVCTNASPMRMVSDVPLLIPEINADHIKLLDQQREQRGWEGMIVASPNCSTTGAVFPMAALHRAFGMTQSHVVTMQAISGAGYPGVASLDILDNIVPYIKNEEGKVESEPLKIMGTREGDHIIPADITVSAQVHRVPVIDGHLAALSIGLAKKASLEEVIQAQVDFSAPEHVAKLPTALEHPMIVRSEPDRPQPRRDRDAADGMAITVGRIQPCNVLDYKLVSLVHNTLRGAASGAILNAELLVAEGYLGEQAQISFDFGKSLSV